MCLTASRASSFTAADVDASGELSISEYFLWSLQNAVELHGKDALKEIFARYDPDHTGQLDMREFQRACDDTGFGAVAAKVFRALDPDASGAISYAELIENSITRRIAKNGAPRDVWEEEFEPPI